MLPVVCFVQREPALTKNVDLASKESQISEICRRYDVRELLLFGSALDSRLRPDSDLDLLVDFQPGSRVGLIRLGQLQEELESLLGRRVDLVPKSGLKPLVRDGILRHTETIYAG
jgi:predicted nucleotidyltransferase